MSETVAFQNRDIATFQIRHGTQDKEVFDQVFTNNQYRLPEKFPEDSVVVDIGANIGAFAAACLMRGAAAVICFEPSEANFQQLCNNLQPWDGKVLAARVGVWRSDVEEEVSFSVGQGSAAGCCFPACSQLNYGNRVNSIGLDGILLNCTDGGAGRVNVLKIDAEFSEYPILFSSTRLDLVDQVIGEAHEFSDQPVGAAYYNHPKYTNSVTGLREFLEDTGFTVETAPESFDNQINTLFWAKRKTLETK